MAGLRELLQRLAHDLEQAGAQQPGDDLRARLGYGSGDDVDDVDDVDETEPGAERARRSTAAGEPETVWKPMTAREPVASPAPATSRAPQAYRASPPSPTTPSHPHPSSESLLSKRIRVRLHAPDALREAFVMKELLDRPLGRRRTR